MSFYLPLRKPLKLGEDIQQGNQFDEYGDILTEEDLGAKAADILNSDSYGAIDALCSDIPRFLLICDGLLVLKANGKKKLCLSVMP